MVRLFSYLALILLISPTAWGSICNGFFSPARFAPVEEILALANLYEPYKSDYLTRRGIELEGYVRYEYGKRAPIENHFKDIKVKFDRETDFDGKVDYQDIEIISPTIETGPQQDRYIKALGSLFDSGDFLEAPEIAGLHIHVDFPGARPAELALLINIWNKIELEIQSHFNVTPNRIQDFANPYKLKRIRKLNARILEGSFDNKYEISYFLGQRYSKHFSLNLRSLEDKGSVEFRIFNSTDNISRILAAIELSTALVNAVRSKDPRLMTVLENTNFEDLMLVDIVEALELEHM